MNRRVCPLCHTESVLTDGYCGHCRQCTLASLEIDEPRLAPDNPTPHLNRARVKRTALEIAKQTRGQSFTRVGLSFLQRIEAKTRAAIAEEVRIHPSKGKTLL